MDNNESKTKKKTANPLPYIIVFAILFLIILGLLTWVLDIFYKNHQCTLYPNIWCSDNWSCNNVCPGGTSPVANGLPVNPCFGNTAYVGPTGEGGTGLASCIFGPTAMGATACFVTPSGGPPTGGTGLSCDCIPEMSFTQNCFSGCAINLTSVTGTTGGSGSPVCCCNDLNNPVCAVELVNGVPTGTGLCAPNNNNT